jgi:hypothetical protein
VRKLTVITFVVCLMTAAGMAQVPSAGNFFFGYSLNHGDTGLTRTGTLNGWEGSLEGRILPHIGLVADVSQHYGSLSIPGLGSTDQRATTFLFGPRLSAGIGPVRPFVHFLIGASHLHEDAGVFGDNTDVSYAQAFGGGVDYHLIPAVSWRLQLDSLLTNHHDAWQDNTRFSTGLVFRF